MASRTVSMFPVLMVLVACTPSSTTEPSPTSEVTAGQPAPPRHVGLVPDLVGEYFLEAIGMVDPPLRIRERYVMSTDRENGTILQQQPPAGTPFDPEGPELLVRVVVALVPG